MHREHYLLAFAFVYHREYDLLRVRTDPEKDLLMAAANLVKCIALFASSNSSC